MEIGTNRGLFDTFRRHYAVLTNNLVNEVKSRPYWPGAGFARGGSRTSGAGPGAQRSGWVLGPDVRGRCSRYHPLQSPCRGLPGPAPLYLPPLDGCTSSVLDPVLPTRYTLPVPYPNPAHPYCTSPPHHTEHPSHPRNRQFGHLVGEPRGSRTRAVFRVPGWFIHLRLVHTAV